MSPSALGDRVSKTGRRQWRRVALWRPCQYFWQIFTFCANFQAKAAEQVGKMRVMGLDPGLRALGWGVIESSGSRLSHVANGVCRTGAGPLGTRLVSLFEQLTKVWELHSPDEAAVEHTFVNMDGASTLKLGQARGIAMLVPAQAGVAVGEYAPNAVKKAVVGVGHADKRQIEHMVRMQLPGALIEGQDAADALAVAICHAHMSRSRALVIA